MAKAAKAMNLTVCKADGAALAEFASRFVKAGVREDSGGIADRASDQVDTGGGGGGGGDKLALDPLLIALLKKVPSADKDWPGPQRVRWFRTFAMNVSQIYDGEGDPVEMRIDLESGSK